MECLETRRLLSASALPDLPNLQVQSLLIDATSTGAVNLSWQDLNSGPGPVGQSFTDSVNVTDAVSGATLFSDVIPYDVARLGLLASGSMVGHADRFTLLPSFDTSHGLNVSVTTDSANTVAETNEADNTQTAALAAPIAPLVDLQAGNASVTADASGHGLLAWEDFNAGIVLLAQPYQDQLLVTDSVANATVFSGTVSYDASQPGAGIDAGSGRPQSVSFNLPSSYDPSHPLSFTVTTNATRTAFESNYSNNSQTVTGSVGLVSAVTLSAVTGRLTVLGTEMSDTITLSRNGGTISVSDDGQLFTFNALQVRSIHVVGNGGDDFVTVDPTIQQPATLDGGAGNDILRAGAGRTKLIAGDGNDILVAGIGQDILVGGAGNDTFVGGGGRDTMLGGIGDQVFFSGSRPDLMMGGSGFNVFATSNGTGDTVVGGSGFNTAEYNPRDTFINVQNTIAPAVVKPPASVRPPAPQVPRALQKDRPHHPSRDGMGSHHVGRPSATRPRFAGRELPTTTGSTPFQAALAIPIGPAPSASVFSGLLAVIGTNGTDTINLRQNSGVINVNVNGQSLGNFAVSSLSQGVFVNPGAGNDTVTLENTQGGPVQAVTTFAYLVVGPGNDGIIGGAGVNYFDMGSSPRQTAGKPSSVSLFGFGTNNCVDFSKRAGGVRVSLDGVASGQLGLENVSIQIPGAAVIYGGLGKDALFGNGSNDNIFADGTADTIIGGTGPQNSYQAARPGSDSIFGGPGINTIYTFNGSTDGFNAGGNVHNVLSTDSFDTVIPPL